MTDSVPPALLKFQNLIRSSKANENELASVNVLYAKYDVSPSSYSIIPCAPINHHWTVSVYTQCTLVTCFLTECDPEIVYGISSVCITAAPSLQLLPLPGNFDMNKQEFSAKGALGVGLKRYQISLFATSASVGEYRQTLICDFGLHPMMAINLEIVSGTLLPCAQIDATLPTNVTVSPGQVDDVVEFDEEDTLTPFEQQILRDHKNRWQRGGECDSSALSESCSDTNYTRRLRSLLLVEETAREQLLKECDVFASIQLCDIFSLATYEKMNELEEGLPEGELRIAAPGELFGMLTLKGCLSEDHPAGRLLVNAANRALIDKISPTPSDSCIVPKTYECLLSEKCRDCVYLRLSSQLVNHYQLKAETTICARIRFQLNRQSFAELHYGLENIPHLSLVFPKFPQPPSKYEGGNKDLLDVLFAGLVIEDELNWKQRQLMQVGGCEESIRCIDKSEGYPPPVLVVGPFGTGKTTALAQLAKRLMLMKESNKVLICTLSNSAADLYICRYFDDWVDENANQYNNNNNSNAFPKPLRVYYTGRWIASIPQKARKYCCFEEGTTILRWPTEEELIGHRLIVCTLVTAKTLLPLIGKHHFTHILIDEAGQAMEANMLIPLCLASKHTTIVLAGDPMQSGPECYSRISRRCGLGTSLLERLWNLYPDGHHSKIQFVANYRSHDHILNFVSQCYYSESLFSCCELSAHPKFYPLTFLATRGFERQDANSTAFYNNAEVLNIGIMVNDILATWPKETWGPVDLTQIGVVTPSAEQVRRIRSELKRRNLSSVNVERVYNVQGKEFKVVIVSTVRTLFRCKPIDADDVRFDLGFLSDPKLLNTALTRAQCLVVVVGDPVSLCSVGACKGIWRQFLEVCDSNGSLLSVKMKQILDHLEWMERENICSYFNPMAPAFVPKPQMTPHPYSAVAPALAGSTYFPATNAYALAYFQDSRFF